MKNIDFLMTTPLWKGLKEEEIEAILPCLRSEEKFIKNKKITLIDQRANGLYGDCFL